MATKALDIKKVESGLSKLPLPKITTSVWWNLGISVASVLIILYLFRKALMSIGLLEDSKAEKEREKLQDKTLDKLNQLNIKPNFTDFQYQQWADAAYEGMKYSNVADDDDAVIGAAKYMLNDADVVKWAAAYGSRQLYYFGLPDGPVKTLFQAMATDLKESSKREINNDWTKKGIQTKI